MGAVPGRIVAELHGARPGPTLIVIGGMHGNEPAGVEACARVLKSSPALVAGDFYAFLGNARALEAKQRFIARDLNRSWNDASVRAAGSLEESEALEVQELAAALDEVLRHARGPVYLVDLHTTSAEGIPFALIGDTLPHREFAAHFPLPVILGLEEQIDGVLTEWMTARGCVTLVVEGGQHQSPESVVQLEAVVWVALGALGLVHSGTEPRVRAAEEKLAKARGALPQFIEVHSRHPIVPADEFVMEPGFANIGRVQKNQLLARDKRGPIRAAADGLVLLPLYQKLGEDGFFFGRELGPVARHASRVGRQLSLDRVLPLLPGVRKAGERLALSPLAAKLYPRGLFRLFGYRRSTGEGASLELSRRAMPARGG